MSRVIVVTGAGRGIGAEICRQRVAAGDTVVACPRRSGSEALGRVASAAPAGRFHEIPMDVAVEDSVAAAARKIGEVVDRVDVLFNNAGVYDHDEHDLDSVDPESVVRTFRVNAVGPLVVTRALLPLLSRGRSKRLAQLTSLMGSVTDNSSGASYGYRMSKAALNMAVKNLALELGAEGFVALAIHPGWVRTRMGGEQAPLSLEAAAGEVIRIALEAGPEHNGTFLGPGGERLPY